MLFRRSVYLERVYWVLYYCLLLFLCDAAGFSLSAYSHFD